MHWILNRPAEHEHRRATRVRREVPRCRLSALSRSHTFDHMSAPGTPGRVARQESSPPPSPPSVRRRAKSENAAERSALVSLIVSVLTTTARRVGFALDRNTVHEFELSAKKRKQLIPVSTLYTKRSPPSDEKAASPKLDAAPAPEPVRRTHVQCAFLTPFNRLCPRRRLVRQLQGRRRERRAGVGDTKASRPEVSSSGKRRQTT